MRRRGLIVGAAAAAVSLAIAGVAGWKVFGARDQGAGSANTQIGGAFDLVDQTGRRVTDRDFRGKPSVMFFGFTYCPEVCPTTLANITLWLKALGPDANKLNVAYVTIDPERDTPKQMALYLSAFDPRIRGLTGTPAQIAKIAGEYKVYYQKIPLPGGSYTMDHSTPIYLMNRAGVFTGLIPYQGKPEDAEGALRDLIRG